MNGLSRLLALRSETTEAGRAMEGERHVFSALKDSEPVRAISSFNLFQTPEHIAERMAKMLGPVIKCLEPSAGLGRLAKVAQCKELVMVEQHAECCDELRRLNIGPVHCRDFLSVSLDDYGLFGGILMNPPFKMGTDVRHYMHAMKLLAPGGRIVGLCYNGTKQNEKLKPMAATWEVLPEASFKSEGTRASVVLLSLQRAV